MGSTVLIRWSFFGPLRRPPRAFATAVHENCAVWELLEVKAKGSQCRAVLLEGLDRSLRGLQMGESPALRRPKRR